MASTPPAFRSRLSTWGWTAKRARVCSTTPPDILLAGRILMPSPRQLTTHASAGVGHAETLGVLGTAFTLSVANLTTAGPYALVWRPLPDSGTDGAVLLGSTEVLPAPWQPAFIVISGAPPPADAPIFPPTPLPIHACTSFLMFGASTAMLS